MSLIKYISIFIITFLSLLNITNADINFTVSPIKYEIDTKTGASITKTATLYNNSTSTYHITTGVSDFEASGNTGNPKFIRKSELVYPDQELASWITINTGSFDIVGGEKKDINFTINVPDNATPGGHYGAVFFKRSTSASGAEVGINVDYGVLLLINVDGTIIEKGDVKDIIISNNSGGGGGVYLKKDDCPLGDLTSSYYDGKCIDDLGIYGLIDKNTDKIDNLKSSDLDETAFNVNFDTLFINEGNTHLKPSGKIKLVDENGKEIKGVGKELVKNKDGGIIGQKIVDYLPINDNDGNVLPYSKRKFQVEWKGFPYEAYDENGKKIIKYWTPEEYYTRQNIDKRDFLMPWERVNERINNKKIKAIIELGYTNREGENIEFNSAKEFKVNYKEKYIGLNPYFFIIVGIILLIIFLLWLLFRKKKKKCEKCGKKINKDMKICPYCGTKQKNTSKKSKKN